MIYGVFGVISGIATAAGMSYFNSYMSNMGGEDITEYLPPTWIYVVQGLVGSIAGVATLKFKFEGLIKYPNYVFERLLSPSEFSLDSWLIRLLPRWNSPSRFYRRLDFECFILVTK